MPTPEENNNNTPVVHRYYPVLSDIVSLEDIPNVLGFIKTSLPEILGKIHYKDLQFNKSARGDAAFYSLTLIYPGRLALGVAGISLVLNPDLSGDSKITAFPITIEYRWKILAFLRTFNSAQVDINALSAKEIFKLALLALNISEEQAIAHVINTFVQPADPQTTLLQQFVADIEEFTEEELSEPDDETTLREVVQEIYTKTGTRASLVAFEAYIFDEDPDIVLHNVKLFFRCFIPDDIDSYIKDLLIPYFKATLTLNGAIEFSRTLLTPVYAADGTNPYDELSPGNPYDIIPPDPADSDSPKVRFTFGKVVLSADSQNGFTYQANFELNSVTPAQIGKTGFIVNILNLKIDLSDSTNLPEADADGRENFKGIYIEEATIGLPKDWADNSTGVVEIKGKELLIGTDGGFSGKIGVEGNGNLKFSLLGIDIDFTSFYVEFKKNAVISSDIKGKLTIEGLKDSKGDDAVLDFTIDWNENGYTIKFENTNGIQLKVPNVVDITLYSLSIGRTDGKWHFSSKGKIDRVADIPKIGAIIPRTLDFKKFEINQGAANDYDIDIKWENDITTTFPKSGLSVDEEHVFPINKTFLKIFTLHLMKFKASGNVQDGADLSALIDADLNLDPIFGTIRGGGLKAAITFPENGGNLGPADIRFSLVTPDSMGIQIKIPGIKGGGWLKKDENEEEYAGLLHLEIQDKLKITAYGILNLRLPNGNAGFSIVGIASVEFTPAIDIAMGLKLGGIGVLFGLNRSMDITALQDSVRDNTLQHLMFPEKPVENASTIISTMGKVFPVNEGQFTFGLLLKAYWGGEKLVTLTMGIMVEVKNPVKIAVAGVLTLSLPDEKNPLVLINAAFLAAVDFEAKKFLLDAKIYDSKIMNASVSGDILARYYWGENSGFLLSIGGFHPSYTPPQMDLPAKINRLAISFINEADKWLKGEFYMAVTSNSVQFGAAVDLYVKITGKYVLKGNFNLDVLVYTKPEFSFMAQMHISAGVYRNSKQLAGVKIDLSLQGPNPYIATGRGSFSIGKLTISANFDVQTKTKKTVIQATANVFEQVVAQFEQEYSWMMVWQGNSAPQVSIADMSDQPSESSPLLLHPMGGLEIKQGVAPLGVKLASFGNARIEAQTPDNIWVAGIKIQGDTVPFTHAEDKFAPGQFFTLSEQEKLKSPSFSNYRAGIRVGSTGKIDTSCIRERSATHETKIIDRSFDYPTRHDNINTAHFDMSLQGNATAVSGISSGRNTQKSSLDSAEDVKIEQEKYHVVFTDTFSDANSGLTFGSFQAAEDSLTTLLASLQLDTTDLIVVRESEYEILID